MKRATREWVRKAEADYQLANRLARGGEPFNDQRAFLCQQAAEKYLKSLLEELTQPIPRTHLLEDLIGLLLPHHPSLRGFRGGMRFLTPFAVWDRAIPATTPPSARPRLPCAGPTGCERRRGQFSTPPACICRAEGSSVGQSDSCHRG